MPVPLELPKIVAQRLQGSLTGQTGSGQTGSGLVFCLFGFQLLRSPDESLLLSTLSNKATLAPLALLASQGG
jgi:hypothetical protein